MPSRLMLSLSSAPFNKRAGMTNQRGLKMLKRKGVLLGFLIISGLILTGCAVKKKFPGSGDTAWGVDVTWHGHSCFTLKDSTKRMIVLDPFDESVGYDRLDLLADALLITHNHFDHNYRRAVKSRLKQLDMVQSTGTVSVAGEIQVNGFPSFHDSEFGTIHGLNILYSFSMGGLRCLHLGDIGTDELPEGLLAQAGQVDILFIPVGGKVTLDAVRAKKMVELINPKVVFPMHYGKVRFFPFDPVEKFTSLFSPDQVRILNESHVRIKKMELQDQPILYILKSISKN
ncbi:MAG: hypothetical protein KCHDKBKB_01235 [Elusimicrobia bacterium]|nr:hypothetical protein [Elusimicrobiota bacterium]